jgi:hypothetical protein
MQHPRTCSGRAVIPSGVKVRFCDRSHFFRRPVQYFTRGKGQCSPADKECPIAATENRTYPSKPIGEATTLFGAVTNPEFGSVVVFCAIGLLLTLNVVLRLPDFTAFLS